MNSSEIKQEGTPVPEPPERESAARTPCDHVEQLHKAALRYLEHDVFQAHPLASGSGLAIFVSALVWGLRYWKRRK